jgi:hypothetical protein
MSTTISGELHGFDTKDQCELTRVACKYSYSVKASGGGTLRFKVEHYTGDEIALDGDANKGRWFTIEERIKIESGHTTTGSFTVPETLNLDGSGLIKLIFSRGLGTQGVDYEFFMEPA